MIGLDDQGDFLTNNAGDLLASPNPAQQNFIAETRCLQTTYSVNQNFGRSYLVWTLSQSVKDRINDLIRISKKYLTVNAISYNETKATYIIV